MKVMIVGGEPSDEGPRGKNSRTEIQESGVLEIAKSLVENGHEILVCSPFVGSADHAALSGVCLSSKNRKVEFHFPNTPEIRKEVKNWETKFAPELINLFPHHPPETNSSESQSYAWLLSQLSALDRASIVLAVGGRVGGSAELLLRLAHTRGKRVLPMTTLGGAAARFFENHRYEYEDLLGDQIDCLHESVHFEQISTLLGKLATTKVTKSIVGLKCFISYARQQSQEADFVEMTLRRRGMQVVRDEAEFAPGHSIPSELRAGILGSQIFVALWSSDYACSPWCFDEIELALDQQIAKELNIWILQLDETRIVPPRARDKLSYGAIGREQLQASLETLINGI